MDLFGVGGNSGGGLLKTVLGAIGLGGKDKQQASAGNAQQGQMSIWAAAQMLGKNETEVKKGDKNGDELISLAELNDLQQGKNDGDNIIEGAVGGAISGTLTMGPGYGTAIGAIGGAVSGLLA